MDLVAKVAQEIKAWVKSRPKLEIEESVTWFLLIFVYAHAVDQDQLGFKFLGIIPQITAPQIGLAMLVLCLTASALILIEPLLPSKLWRWATGFRRSFLQPIRLMSILFAFAFGLATGLGLLIEKVPTLSWLTNSAAVVGFVIFVILGIRFVLYFWTIHAHARNE
ncbi:MAG: hypothetical protein J4F32_06635 [Dehalococcoidia bacterium]|nr:hypothetical protein [Dehalococcoidia bacterium]